MSKTRKHGIDVFKFAAAFAILFLHTSYGNLNHEVAIALRLSARWAVPFFFLATGYFLGKKIEQNSLSFSKIEHNVSRLISIFIVSSFVYLIYSLVSNDVWIDNDLQFFLWGGFWHLWFIGSMLFGYLFLWYAYNIGFGKYLLPVSIILLAVCIFSDLYNSLFALDIDYFSMPRFLSSIPFMYFGIRISKKNLSSISTLSLGAIGIILFTLQFFEVQLLSDLTGLRRYDVQLPLFTALSAIAIFLLSAKIKPGYSFFSRAGREYSLFIYLYHVLIFLVSERILLSIQSIDIKQVYKFFPLVGFPFVLILAILTKKYFPLLFGFLTGDFGVLRRNSGT